jgi:charged multivesicular body protein 4
MFKLFGKKKEEVKENNSMTTILMLKDTISTLEKRKEFIEKNIENERNKAKQYVENNNREKAIIHIKKIKMYEKEYKTIDGNIFNLETQRIAIESQITLNSVVDAMKLSSKSLETMIKPEKISELMDNISEQIQTQQEISDELSRPIINFDEDELLQEFENLSTTPTPTPELLLLPSVPLDKPVIIQKTEDEELEELKKMMESIKR